MTGTQLEAIGLGPRDAQIIEELQQFIPEVLRVTVTPGVSVALARNGEIIWEGAFGYSQVRGRVPMTPQAVTRGGSMTKLYTAVAAMQLIELGVMDLYSPVGSLIPDVSLANPLGEREITVYDLLTFRSGLSFDSFEGSLSEPPSLAEYVRRSFHRDARHEYRSDRSRWGAKVGDRYQYSNLGIAALGYIIERTNPDALSYSDYIARHIVEPLGMRSTLIPSALDANHVPADVLDRLATGYARFGNSLLRSPVIQCPGHPALGLLTMASDQLRLVLALANGGRYQGARILRSDSVRLMLTPQARLDQPALAADSPMWVGLVVESYDIDSPRYSFGHEGVHVWGWWNDCRVYPYESLAFAVTANAWDMMRWYTDRDQSPTGLIGQFLRDAYADDRETVGPDRSWGWKRSYAMGMFLSERCQGLLGTDPLPPEWVFEALSDSATRDGALDYGGFRAGLESTVGLEMTAESCRSLIASDRFPLTTGELRLLALEFGRKGVLTIPMPFWAKGGGIPAFDPDE